MWIVSICHDILTSVSSRIDRLRSLWSSNSVLYLWKSRRTSLPTLSYRWPDHVVNVSLICRHVYDTPAVRSSPKFLPDLALRFCVCSLSKWIYIMYLASACSVLLFSRSPASGWLRIKLVLTDWAAIALSLIVYIHTLYHALDAEPAHTPIGYNSFTRISSVISYIYIYIYTLILIRWDVTLWVYFRHWVFPYLPALAAVFNPSIMVSSDYSTPDLCVSRIYKYKIYHTLAPPKIDRIYLCKTRLLIALILSWSLLVGMK